MILKSVYMYSYFFGETHSRLESILLYLSYHIVAKYDYCYLCFRLGKRNKRHVCGVSISLF